MAGSHFSTLKARKVCLYFLGLLLCFRIFFPSIYTPPKRFTHLFLGKMIWN